MTDYRKYEKDERAKLRRLVEDMNRVHSEMGGRDERPERVALHTCMRILQAEIDRSTREYLKESEHEDQDK